MTVFADEFAVYALPDLLTEFGESVTRNPDGTPTVGTGIVSDLGPQTGGDADGEHQVRRLTLKVAEADFTEPVMAPTPDEWLVRSRRYRVVAYSHPPAAWMIELEVMEKQEWSGPELRRS